MSIDQSAPRVRRLRRSAASRYLKETWDLDFKIATLAKYATIGGGPEMEYVGRIPLYPMDSLDSWAAAKISPRVSSTSERSALVRAERNQPIAA